MKNKEKTDNQKFIEKLSALAKEIIIFNSGFPAKNLTRKQELDAFYKIMRKYGIKQGTWNKNGTGRNCNNFEWTLCLEAFRTMRSSSAALGEMMNTPPDDLLAYGKKPKSDMVKKYKSL